ncbi:MAG TPA: CGNR zinc finger domain-containing protein [Solirubrobacteraceae bacterium]|nr:CGNR zinc finger domain-containing protein [Solirubrobacteraceae bacterium]
MTASVAPAGVEPIRAFVNTCDRERGTEELASPAALGAWLAGRGLLDQDAAVTRAELRRAIELREALRAVLVAHAGRELDAAAPAVLERAARRARLEVRFDAGARARPEPLAPGVDGALGRLLALVAAAQEDGTWPRLKACVADDCRWAFYDRSRNRSAVWCDMGVCGNREKVRAYRERASARRT